MNPGSRNDSKKTKTGSHQQLKCYFLAVVVFLLSLRGALFLLSLRGRVFCRCRPPGPVSFLLSLQECFFVAVVAVPDAFLFLLSLRFPMRGSFTHWLPGSAQREKNNMKQRQQQKKTLVPPYTLN